MKALNRIPKKNKIIFPHRLAPEKQVEIFKDLAASMPEYEWFIAQEHNLTKHDYHKHLAESKIMFSANLQETLGISAYEAALVGTFPMLPDRLSYSEMWDADKLYPNHWTDSWENYQASKEFLMLFIDECMDYDLTSKIEEMVYDTGNEFFNGEKLYSTIKGNMT